MNYYEEEEEPITGYAGVSLSQAKIALNRVCFALQFSDLNPASVQVTGFCRSEHWT